jgi:hypothetical protein
MTRRRGLPFLVALFAIAATAGACAFGPAATFEQGVEHLPGPGYIHLVTQPATAETDLTVVLIMSDGADSSVSTSVVAGDPVVVDRTTLPGAYGVRMNGTPCEGRIPVQGDRQTDVVVRLATDGCTIAVRAIHDPEEMRPP